MIDTPQGKGKVIRQNLLKGSITALLEDGRELEIETKDKDEESSNYGL
jgi:hypothetical protein